MAPATTSSGPGAFAFNPGVRILNPGVGILNPGVRILTADVRILTPSPDDEDGCPQRDPDDVDKVPVVGEHFH